MPTVYYTFGTKAALLSEALGAAIVGVDVWRKPPDEPVDIRELLPWNPWWRKHAGAGEPEAAEVVRAGEQRRVASYREAIGILALKPGGLRRGLSEAEATDTLVVLFSAELYQALAVGRGWPPGRCLDFLGDVLRAQLLSDPPH